MRLLFMLLLIQLLPNLHLVAQDNIKNLPEYSLPLTNKKLVIAHCMTNIIRYKGHKLEDSCDPDYYGINNNSTASLGGLTQVVPVAGLLLQEASLDSAVSFEMHNAIAAGIDGFQFYYTLGGKDWDDIIKAYFRVADKQHLDFKFTFCISHPKGYTEQWKIKIFADRINDIFNVVGRNNTHWLRTPDGRLLTYLWYGEQLADIPDMPTKPEAYYAALAYKKLGEAIGEKLACIYSINEQITKKKLNDYLDYFPACWIWTLPYNKQYIGYAITDQVKKRNRTFTGSVFGDFYTSKLLKRDTWDMYKDAKDAVEAGINEVERKYIVTGLTYNFRKLFEFAIEQNTSIINIITWNDYPEGHHLAPELNHNDGFSILLNHYKSIWTKNPSPYKDRDVVAVFFKKYVHNIQPKPYNIKIVAIEKAGINLASEDSIEVVSLLTSPAQLHLNDKTTQLSNGFTVTTFAAREGNVKVGLYRNEQLVLGFTTPASITAKPVRTDKLTYSFSSEMINYYQKYKTAFDAYLH